MLSKPPVALSVRCFCMFARRELEAIAVPSSDSLLHLTKLVFICKHFFFLKCKWKAKSFVFIQIAFKFNSNT